ncbi:hypothetical protein ACFQZ4_09115 [Catellatospora coxensis]|uniref:Uncharacterized protein n=1 Tax=Catellatospora coxensis TaxID=310354 RepID=A0A8J3KKY0_9ACTN|nr:hypothetical protein [Catellatospora coxensis]GIG04902.1 hypothetical protein Cco03nite_16020 [Catellatospora coxensis]
MYDRGDLVRVYLGAQGEGFGGYYADSATFNAALKAHYEAMLGGLEQLFGLRLSMNGVASFDNRVLFMLFTSTTRSLLALRTPWSGFLESSLLVKKIEEAGANGQRVMAATERIVRLTDESHQVHLDMLDALVAAMLGDRAEATFSADDLRALGVDVTGPDPNDYPLYED